MSTTWWWPILRRSVAVSTLPAFGLVLVTHLWLRPRGWVHEWYWTIDAYNFVTILLAPVVAGVATWDGARWSGTADTAASIGRTASALRAAAAPTALWSSISFLAGLLAAVVLTSTSGTPGFPRAAEAFAALPALVMLWLASAAGAIVGWLTRRSLAGPIVAISLFGILFAGYTVLPQNLLRVGGATGTLISLAPRSGIQALQVLLYAAIITAAVLAAQHLSARNERRGLALGMTLASAAVFAFVLTAVGGMRFADAAPTLRCAGTAPEVCLAPGYEDLRAAITRAVAEPFATFAAAGFDPPQRVTQDVLDSAEGSVLVDGDVPTMEDIHGLLVFAIVPPDCDLYQDPATYRAFSNVWYWVGTLLNMNMGPDPDVAPVIAAGDSPGSRAMVRAIEAELDACHSLQR